MYGNPEQELQGRLQVYPTAQKEKKVLCNRINLARQPLMGFPV